MRTKMKRVHERARSTIPTQPNPTQHNPAHVRLRQSLCVFRMRWTRSQAVAVPRVVCASLSNGHSNQRSASGRRGRRGRQRVFLRAGSSSSSRSSTRHFIHQCVSHRVRIGPPRMGCDVVDANGRRDSCPEFVERLNNIEMEHGLLVGFFPPCLFPSRRPFGDTVDRVPRIRVDVARGSRFRQVVNRVSKGEQFRALIRLRLRSGHGFGKAMDDGAAAHGGDSVPCGRATPSVIETGAVAVDCKRGRRCRDCRDCRGSSHNRRRARNRIAHGLPATSDPELGSAHETGNRGVGQRTTRPNRIFCAVNQT
jgi:hypothetical protein